MSYTSPCYPCEYNSFAVDEFGDPIYDICSKPEGGKCWIEEWAKELEEKKNDTRII